MTDTVAPMTDPGTDVKSPMAPRRGAKATIARWRRATSLLTLASLLIVVVVGWILYNRPAHVYSVPVNAATWRADVMIALKERPATGPITPRGRLQHLPGVGPIMSVYVNGSGKHVSVLFLTNVGMEENGLAYLQGLPPPSDSCNVHLSGPWWQISPLNTTTNGCARGYHYTPGG
jgi:hypothetical protein